ncbi:MAG: alpha/beta hydrolase [Humibacillus sp.]
MLNDPTPDDLPQAPPSPYAALPPELATRQPVASSPAPALGFRRRWLVAAVAVMAILALLAGTLAIIWGAVRGPDPRAINRWTPAAAGDSADPAPGGTPANTTPDTTPGTTGPSRSAAPRPTDYPVALAAYYTQQVSWEPCADDRRQQCATMQVPVDYATPTGDRFTLALRKAPATDASKRLGTLIINPGGPGASGVQYAQLSAFAFTPALRAAYDVVGFDPRGIGASSPVGCLTDADMDRLFTLDPTPDTAAERTELLSESDRITTDCARRGGERARHLSTTEVARDMDVLRVLVGDQRLTFLGVSYGTFLGAVYADTFPSKVGRLVLDSAISPNQTDEQEMSYDIQGFESSIGAFIDWCVARSDCALGSDKAAARGKIVSLLDTVEKSELATSKPGLERIGEGWVGFSIFMCLYSAQSWPTLNKGLAQAFSGRGDILLAKGMSVVERSASGRYDGSTYLQAMLPVRCADWPRSPSSGALKSAQEAAQAAHPLWARMTGLLFDSCRTWPTAGRAPKGSTLAKGAAPILVIGNERDPATPIGGTKQLAQDLASGVLLTSDHDGHGTYFAGSSCVDTAVDGYLIRGVVPRSGTAC